jgi:hypothetical protein
VSWINSERLQKLLAIENARDNKLLVNGIHELSEHESWQATHSAQLNGLKESQERIEEVVNELGSAQARNHEFIVTVVGSLEERIMEMQRSQVRWIEMYEKQLAVLLGRTETIPWTAEQIALIQTRLDGIHGTLRAEELSEQAQTADVAIVPPAQNVSAAYLRPKAPEAHARKNRLRKKKS